MSSDDVGRQTNLPAFYGLDKSEWPVLSGRYPPDAVDFIDEAAAARGLKRGHFVVQAVIEVSEQVLGRPFVAETVK